ncbi:hypothetical protein PV327_002203 [Microctonus hyperodae]|uniref:Vezatin n=2 Tax=Microctonus hyperodae TaxID=165561 RepID=A0AA39KNU7_MICHY|nr:hypothetical protein PV327_002203 [Microctonus hyperodae]
MTNENDFDDEDVVIEDSDLHKALIDMGYTDFECTPINRSVFFEVENEVDNSMDSSPPIKREWLWNFLRRIKDCSWLYKPKIKSLDGISSLEIISRLDPLLDDHSVMIQNMLKKNSSPSNKRWIFQWPYLIISNCLIVSVTLFYKPLRIVGLIAIPSMTTLIFTRIYSELNSNEKLKNLVLLQNNIHHLYKRTLKILKNGYFLILSQRQLQKRFCNLDIERLKYLQPICEYFLKSMEITSRTYYKISITLMKLISQYKNISVNNLITKFDNSSFITIGEITYEKLKQHYYIFILVQSEMMQIFAILYENNLIENQLIYSQLIRIIDLLTQLIKKQQINLNKNIEQYKSTKVSQTRRELKNKVGTKLQDLYLHVDLLARKIRSAFNVVDSIIDDIDNCTNDDDSARVIDLIVEKMNEAYKEIDTARNFAEFNNLLLGKFRQIHTLKNDNVFNSTTMNSIEKMLPIVRDSDPQIFDEVFEEYIKDEYLKPLYEDTDFDSLEKGKLDKLLAKNFMSELKEVLIDKYKTMSEREAKALLHYRKKAHDTNSDNSVDNNHEDRTHVIPSPPPLPKSLANENDYHSEEIKIRTPVPLPRLINTTFSPTARRRQKVERDLEPELIKANEDFLIDIQRIKLPAFTTNEETFVGSGENSEEEIIIDNDFLNENL